MDRRISLCKQEDTLHNRYKFWEKEIEIPLLEFVRMDEWIHPE